MRAAPLRARSRSMLRVEARDAAIVDLGQTPHLSEQLVERRKVAVAFEQHRDAPHALDRIGEEIEDAVADRLAVRVDDNPVRPRKMTCDVDLNDAVSRDTIDVGSRIEAVVSR